MDSSSAVSPQRYLPRCMHKIVRRGRRKPDPRRAPNPRPGRHPGQEPATPLVRSPASRPQQSAQRPKPAQTKPASQGNRVHRPARSPPNPVQDRRRTIVRHRTGRRTRAHPNGAVHRNPGPPTRSGPVTATACAATMPLVSVPSTVPAVPDSSSAATTPTPTSDTCNRFRPMSMAICPRHPPATRWATTTDTSSSTIPSPTSSPTSSICSSKHVVNATNPAPRSGVHVCKRMPARTSSSPPRSSTRHCRSTACLQPSLQRAP